jgi:hypothetical protein
VDSAGTGDWHVCDRENVDVTTEHELSQTSSRTPANGPRRVNKPMKGTGYIGYDAAGVVARHNGTAPPPVWSSNKARHRLSRTGNRQLNAALHRMAMTQMRVDAQPRRWSNDAIPRGDGGMEALRILKRRLSDVVYQALRADLAITAEQRVA